MDGLMTIQGEKNQVWCATQPCVVVGITSSLHFRLPGGSVLGISHCPDTMRGVKAGRGHMLHSFSSFQCWLFLSSNCLFLASEYGGIPLSRSSPFICPLPSIKLSLHNLFCCAAQPAQLFAFQSQLSKWALLHSGNACCQEQLAYLLERSSVPSWPLT